MQQANQCDASERADASPEAEARAWRADASPAAEARAQSPARRHLLMRVPRVSSLLSSGAGKVGAHTKKSAGGPLPEHQTQTLTQGGQNLSLRTKITELGRKHQLHKPLLCGPNQAMSVTNDTNARATRSKWAARPQG